MKQRLYVRVAKRPRGSYVRGSTYKVDGSPSHNPRPLEQGGKLLKTLHFAVDLQLPEELFNDPAMPVVTVAIEPGEGYAVEPTVVQVETAPPTVES